ncbi:FUSC family protein [uncultured Clostridium sp.]|uniref:FUSC family protein n=1 Tax=uncultured Clostridium sp. TaxID=59620 RepID=UPI00261301DE|nr:FUSC family protein [uncultured Clostridium sp.]
MDKLTALKIYIVALIIIATFIPFGQVNIIIPVASILLVPSLATDDYKSDSIKNIIKLFSTFLILSISASIIGLNLYIGIFITFIVVFSIYYLYTYEDKKSKAISYILYYVLILSIPINKDEIPLRLTACIYGAIITVALYYTLSKINLFKTADLTIEDAYDNLNTAILLKIQNDNYYDFILKALSESVIADSILIRQLHKFSKNNDITIKKEITLDLMKSLASIINKTEDTNVLRDISKILKWVIKLYKDDIDITEFKENISANIYLSSGYENSLIKKYIATFLELYENDVLNTNERYGRHYIKSVIKKYDTTFNLNTTFAMNMDSLKFNIAIKGSILITIVTFIIYTFNLSEGKWILYTVAVTYLPFTGTGIKKIKATVLGLILGFILLNLVLIFVDSKLLILILILIGGYLALTITSYSKQIILTTFCVVASSSMFNSFSYNTLGISRFIYVIIGGLLTYMTTKYIYPVKVKQKIRNIYKSYIKLNEEILKNIEEKSVEELFNEIQSKKKSAPTMTSSEILIVYRILLMKSRFLSSYLKTKYAERFDIKETLIIGDYKNIARIEDENIILKLNEIPLSYSKSSLIENLKEFNKPVKKAKKEVKQK